MAYAKVPHTQHPAPDTLIPHGMGFDENVRGLAAPAGFRASGFGFGVNNDLGDPCCQRTPLTWLMNMFCLRPSHRPILSATAGARGAYVPTPVLAIIGMSLAYYITAPSPASAGRPSAGAWCEVSDTSPTASAARLCASTLASTSSGASQRSSRRS